MAVEAYLLFFFADLTSRKDSLNKLLPKGRIISWSMMPPIYKSGRWIWIVHWTIRNCLVDGLKRSVVEQTWATFKVERNFMAQRILTGQDLVSHTDAARWPLPRLGNRSFPQRSQRCREYKEHESSGPHGQCCSRNFEAYLVEGYFVYQMGNVPGDLEAQLKRRLCYSLPKNHS